MQWITILLFGLMVHAAHAQDPASLLQEGKALERKHKEDEALAKYSEVIKIQPTNMEALLKSAEMQVNIGGREVDPVKRKAHFMQALELANQAYELDSTKADVAYHQAVAYRNLGEVEEKRDIAVNYLRQWKTTAEKAYSLDPAHPKTNHLLGRWHLEVLSQGGIRKASTKLLYGGLPEANIKTAMALMEVCKQAEPYYCPNFLDLAKAYDFNRNYEKAIQTLEQLAKLPTRRFDDIAIKAEGKVLLQKLQ